MAAPYFSDAASKFPEYWAKFARLGLLAFGVKKASVTGLRSEFETMAPLVLVSEDPNLDGPDRDAGVEVLAVEVPLWVVVVESGGHYPPAVIRISGVVRMAGRSVPGAPGADGCARRSTGVGILGRGNESQLQL